jgi:hypothetical protein
MRSVAYVATKGTPAGCSAKKSTYSCIERSRNTCRSTNNSAVGQATGKRILKVTRKGELRANDEPY